MKYYIHLFIKKIPAFAISLFFLLSTTLSAQNENLNTELNQTNSNLVDSIITYSKKFLGKPYKYIHDNEVFDCSGFLKHSFNKYNIEIPRVSSEIAKHVKKIDENQIEVGDLVFFKPRQINNNRIGHVAIIAEKNGSSIKMIHSCRRGIVIDSLTMPYYKKRFLFAGRILPPPTITTKTDTVKLNSDTLSENSNEVTIIGVGDIMLGTNYPSTKYLPPNDGKDLLTGVSEILNSSNITFGNLEGVILTQEGTSKKCSDPTKCYSFKSPNHYALHLKNAGFDVLSIANNHIGDFGEVGKKNTVTVLDSIGIYFAGIEDFPFTIFEKDSIKYGFCAFAPNKGTIKLTDYDRVQEIVQHLDSLVDIIIVSVHGGGEGFEFLNIQDKTEYYLGENRGNLIEFAKKAIDAGADIIFGHGPHVPRAVDLYKNRFIAYSLGNFATYARFNLSKEKGYAPIIKVHTDKQGEFLKAEIISCFQRGEGGPELDEENKAFQLIKKLTQEDFPKSDLIFKENGEIIKRIKNE